MPVTIHYNGIPYHADDGVDPAELQQYAAQHQAERQQTMNPMNQGFGRMLGGIVDQVQDYQEQPQPTAIPSGVNTYGMSPQELGATAGIIQQDQQFSATQKMRQRIERERALEAEKERSQQLAVQDMQFKNQQKLEKMRMDQEEARMRREAELKSTQPIETSWGMLDPTKGYTPIPGSVPRGEPELQVVGEQVVDLGRGTARPIQGFQPRAAPKDAGAFTIGPGQQRVGADGTVIAAMPPAAAKPEPWRDQQFAEQRIKSIQATASALIKDDRENGEGNMTREQAVAIAQREYDGLHPNIPGDGSKPLGQSNIVTAPDGTVVELID